MIEWTILRKHILANTEVTAATDLFCLYHVQETKNSLPSVSVAGRSTAYNFGRFSGPVSWRQCIVDCCPKHVTSLAMFGFSITDEDEIFPAVRVMMRAPHSQTQ